MTDTGMEVFFGIPGIKKMADKNSELPLDVYAITLFICNINDNRTVIE